MKVKVPPFLKIPVAAAWLALAVAVPVVHAAVDYNRDIRPILSENCFSCHGFDEKGRKAKLRLDMAEDAYVEHESGTPIQPGDLLKSEVWVRVSSTDKDEVMPPPKSHRTLTAGDKAKIKQWIEEGAKYAGHWAFIPPRRPEVPATGSANPIDAFIRARLAREGLEPAPEADRAMLIRRVTLDLTGLPPSAEEVAQFLKDNQPDAYARLVDRLLANPHFGERMALDWLDASRYADTNGYSIDGGRNAWLWRDYVIHAFNTNKPYNQFLTEQIAGDLLPSPTPEQLVATGFQRNNMVTHEGGTIPEENLTNYNVDRVKTLGEAVLGLTLACAQCHDHKYDPIKQRDYYQLFAYFNTLGDRGLDGDGGVNAGPVIQAKTILQADDETVVNKELSRLRQQMENPPEQPLRAWEAEQRELLAGRGKGLQLHPIKLLGASAPNKAGAISIAEEGRFVHINKNAGVAPFDISMQLPQIDQPITGIRVVMHPSPQAPLGGWGYGGGKDEKGSFVLTGVSLSADAVAADQVNIYRLLQARGVTANCWDENYRPEGTLNTRTDAGWAPDIRHDGPVHLTITLAEPLSSKETAFLNAQLIFGMRQNKTAARMEFFALTGTDDGSLLTPEIIDIVQRPQAERSSEQEQNLRAYFAAHAPAMERTRVAIANLEQRLAVLTKPFPAMVMNIAPKPRATFILNRGNYAAPGEQVSMATPAFLPAAPAEAPANRLGLAQWITMPENPLTARVAVNRFWQLLFGTGIVKTVADFGAQGEWPSHPELLDWLAVDFMESGWDVKAIVRKMVLSETYRQTSVTAPELLERDPGNRLLARGPRFRLPAEFIRDSALKISGMLVPRLGGPSVNPYTPGDPWREVSHYGSTPATAQTFVQDHGEKLYRRSLYTFWKRTLPPPSMAAFDAPNRELCTVSRPSTTTPLQALVLLNDVQYVEASRAFAERILHQPGDDLSRLRWAFIEATSREPHEKEAAVLERALKRERVRYAADLRAATAYLASGESPRDEKLPPAEHAAWAQISSLLLNLSETITRN